jgi:hypothetical protein
VATKRFRNHDRIEHLETHAALVLWYQEARHAQIR